MEFSRVQSTFSYGQQPEIIPRKLFQDAAIENDFIEKIEFFNKKEYEKKEEEKKQYFEAQVLIAEADGALLARIFLEMIAELRKKLEEELQQRKEVSAPLAPIGEAKPKTDEPLDKVKDKLDELSEKIASLEKEAKQIEEKLSTETQRHNALWVDTLSNAKSAFINESKSNSNSEDVFKAMCEKMNITIDEKDNPALQEKKLADQKKLKEDLEKLNEEVAESLGSRASIPDVVSKRQADWNAAYKFEVERNLKQAEKAQEEQKAKGEEVSPINLEKINEKSKDKVAEDAVKMNSVMTELLATAKAFQKNSHLAYDEKGNIRPGIVPKDKSDRRTAGGAIQAGKAYAGSKAMKAYNETLYGKNEKNEKGESVTIASEATKSAKTIIGLKFDKADNADKLAKAKQELDDLKHQLAHKENPKESIWTRLVNGTKDLAKRVTNAKQEPAATLKQKSPG